LRNSISAISSYRPGPAAKKRCLRRTVYIEAAAVDGAVTKRRRRKKKPRVEDQVVLEEETGKKSAPLLRIPKK
jgi:hypothetical protein